jgi:hypothetical protein
MYRMVLVILYFDIRWKKVISLSPQLFTTTEIVPVSHKIRGWVGVMKPPTIQKCGHSHHSSSLSFTGTDLWPHNIGVSKLITCDLTEGISSKVV